MQMVVWLGPMAAVNSSNRVECAVNRVRNHHPPPFERGWRRRHRGGSTRIGAIRRGRACRTLRSSSAPRGGGRPAGLPIVAASTRSGMSVVTLADSRADAYETLVHEIIT